MSLKNTTYTKIALIFGLSSIITLGNWMLVPAQIEAAPHNNILALEVELPVDTDEVDLPYPFDDGMGGPDAQGVGGMYLDNPSNVQSGFEYDPETGTYHYYEKIGDTYFKNPTYMDFDEYIEYDSKKALQDYWKQKAKADDVNQTRGFKPELTVKSKAFDRLFGGNKIEIIPQGSAELSFGINRSTRDNPALPTNQRSSTTFDFDQQIQLNVTGKIGEKLKLSTAYNTQATFDFENQMKIEYTGYEDEIIQKVEAGNVSLPLKGSLITGSQTLFGIKTELRFGRLTVTSVLSQEKGEKKEINVQGGAQIQDFERNASEYEENKHYFLSQYFRDTYESSLSNPPIISSRANITKIEVWVSNVNSAVENTKNIIGFMDLGESSTSHIYNNALIFDNNPTPGADFPQNNGNTLYPDLTANPFNPLYDTSAIRGFTTANQALDQIGYENGVDYEKYENARLLRPSEFTLNPQLGYISLNSALNPDNILAVSFQYTLDGAVYQVGEFSTDGVSGQDALYVKLLKGTTINTNLPTWDLMMKNVYSLGAFNISPTDFYLNIFYLNPATGVEIPFLPEGAPSGLPLIGVLNVDKLNTINQPNPDGVFDFIDGITINSNNGRVYFPVLEPFGSHLRSQFNDPAIADKYAYDSLYVTTQILAEQDANKNRFKIKGQYSSSSSSDISLNSMNIPEGSVKVTAGGAALTENVDYTVDYNLGRVKIINDGILQSGAPIKISLESQSLFSIQTKTLMGSRLDYKINDNFNIGGTVLRLSEKPLTQKVSIGDEPINNTIWGLDVNYSHDLPFLTRWVDKLPIYSTKEKSSMTFEGEFAHIIPGNPGAITKEGIAYMDDFEGSQSKINMNTVTRWKLASTPQGQPDLFPEGEGALSNTLAYGFNRAKLAWYVIDPLFWRNDSRTPAHIKNDPTMQSNQYMREVLQTEVFPFKSPNNGIVTNIPVLDLAYYPKERGQYNFDDGTSSIASGINPTTGELNNPSTRWAGIMRSIQTTDFASSNVEFIQFWVMDPFDATDGNPNSTGGKLYFNLGNISEDILKDDRKGFENGMPLTAIDYNTGLNANLVDTTVWGRVPTVSALVNAFDNNPATRPFQDIGMDGLNDADEAAFFGTSFGIDPSGDNYHYYAGTDYDAQQLDILERYKKYNGVEGNSPVQANFPDGQATTRPDIEDINSNNNLDFRESYYQYVVNITPTDVNPNNVGNNYITNVFETTVTTKDGNTKPVRWYQFKIPIKIPDKVVGDIQGFKSIRFMRMFLKGFDDNVVLRFATMDLIRGEWRKYTDGLLSPGDYLGNDDDETTFDISAVNVEENSSKTPVNYIIPPGIDRQINPNPTSGTTVQKLNEQALVLDVCNLKDGDARAAYKVMDLDIRKYKRLKMFVHAEESDPNFPLGNDDLSIFIRMGTDYDNNYYEYEVPLKVTPAGSYNTENSSNEQDRYVVWPEANNVDLVFDKLTLMKIRRNSQLSNGASGVQIIKPYSEKDGKNTMRIKGNPNIANVRVFMIGIRNTKQSPITYDDDGMAKCAEIWVNELRLTDFRNEGGWATKARLTTQVADLGNIAISGDYSTPGFGSIEQKLNERQQETRRSYDLSSNVELGKFIPEKVGLSIPMYYNVSEAVVTPQYVPTDPDLELKDVLETDLLTQEFKDSIAVRSQEVTNRRAINFTNVRKLRPKGKTKSHFYDISNFAFNYGYSKSQYRDVDTEFNTRTTHKGGFGYAFGNNPKNYKPFAKSKIGKKKAFKWLKDFNFYLMPKQLSFQTDVDRMYSEKQSRNNTGFDFKLPTYYQKHFYWNRIYSLKYDITKALKFDFNATNNATILEPTTFNGQETGGRVDPNRPEEYQDWKNSVNQSFRDFGTNTQYHHNFNVNYKVPINKLPYLDFINLTTRYSADYDWRRAPIGADTLGNTIQNSNGISVNTQLNMTKFYNQIKPLKKVEKRQRDRARARALRNKKNDPNKTQAQNAKAKGWKAGTPPANIKFDTKKFKDSDTTKVELWKKRIPFKPLDPILILLMSPKNISGTYTTSKGTLLPGYDQESDVLGSAPGFNAPGFDFVSGVQNPDFALGAAEQDWLVPTRSLIYNYATTYSENYNIRATLRPVKTLRIQLNISRNYSTNLTQQFFATDPTSFVDTLNGELRNDYFFVKPVEMGNFSMSFISFKTAFSNDDELDRSNDVFDAFLEERAIISQRLGEENGNSNAINNVYAEGYGATSQDVLIPAFIAGYSGQSGKDVSLKSFQKYIPKPNWRVTYDGLSKMALIGNWFKKFTLTHAYRSKFNVSSFTSNLAYTENADGANAIDIANNFIPKLQIATVSISEQFSPLIGVDMTLNNNMLIRVEYKRDRNASLSMANNQITEVKGIVWSVGTGYKFRQVKLPFVKSRVIKSDIDTRVDVSIRDNSTIVRKIVEEVNQITGGQKVLSVKFTADYRLSAKLNIRFFYDYISNTPFISTTFPTSNTNAGFSLRFTLSQ